MMSKKQLQVVEAASIEESSIVGGEATSIVLKNSIAEPDSFLSSQLWIEKSKAEEMFDLGQALKKNCELEKAADLFRAVLEINPEHGWASHCLAQTLHWLGDTDESIEFYQNAVRLFSDENKATPLCQLAELQAITDKLSDAWISLREARIYHEFVDETPDYISGIQSVAEKIEWLFDANWYLESIDEEVERKEIDCTSLNAALHYLENGYLNGCMPHWIFDKRHVDLQLANTAANEVPLVLQFIDGLVHGPVITPSWIIDYESIAPPSWPDSLERFQYLVNENFETTPACTSVLFDASYYAQNIDDDETNIIKHYLLKGYKERLSPHPAFNINWYCDTLGLDEDCDAVYHYLIEGGCMYASPNPVFDLEYYLEQFPELDAALNPPLVHFLEQKKRRGTLPLFDGDFYLESNPDINECGMCAEKHFLEFGSTEEKREPFLGFSSQMVRSKYRSPGKYNLSDAGRYYAEKAHRKTPVLVVSHSASRTGAPLIALKLVEELSRIDSLELYVVVFGSGPLVTDFKKLAHVCVTENKWGGDENENTKILSRFLRKKPLIAFCNSSESRHFAATLRAADILVISLVHEIADHFKDGYEWGKIFDVSEHVVFPSYYVKDSSDRKLHSLADVESSHCSVISQGLLTHNFARFGVEEARRQARARIGVALDKKVVLGCGTIDLRKGIDLFLDCAKITIANKLSPDSTFVWVGGQQPGSDNDNPVYWAMKGLGADDKARIVFIEDTDCVEEWFLAADVFLLSSRSDPYPCVMHEAMAAKLPIVYLQGTGGSAELVNDRFGVGVPYEDVHAMSESLIELMNDDSRRHSMSESASQFVRDECKFSDYVAKLCLLARDIVRTSDHSVMGDDVKELGYLDVLHAKKPQVYFLSSDWDISGVNSLTEIIVRGLNEMGLESRVLFTRGRMTEFSDRLSFLRENEVEFLDVDDSLDHPLNVHTALLAFLRRHDPCVLVPNYDYTASELSPYIPDHIGLVGVVHSDDSEHYEHANRLGHYWNRIVAVSDRIGDRVGEINPGFRPRTSCIRNGVNPILDVDDLIDDPRDTRNTVKLVYTGRMSHFQKRIERYAELIVCLDKQNIQYEFNFVGQGEALEDMKSMLQPQIKSGNVIFHGGCTVQETLDILRECDLFTLFSDFEGLSMSLLEALGAGCIPLVYDMDSGINHLIDNGVNGFILDSRTVEEAVPIVERLQTGSERSEIRVQSRKLLDSHDLTSNVLVKKYHQLFTDVLEECESEQFKRPRWIHASADFH